MRRRRADKLLAVLAQAAESDRNGDVPLAMLTQRTGLNRTEACESLGVLCRRGLARKVEPGLYVVTSTGRAFCRDGGQVTGGPYAGTAVRVRRGTLRNKLWRAARMARKFTIADLLQLCGEGSLDGARKYLDRLERAGYLRRLGNRPKSAGAGNVVRWVLIRDTGRLSPVLNAARTTVYDPNTGETHDVA